VLQAVFAIGAVFAVCLSLSSIEYPFHQELPALHRELRPKMCHESLLARGLDPVERGGSHFLNNVLGSYT
jgi:hypothetical protein